MTSYHNRNPVNFSSFFTMFSSSLCILLYHDLFLYLYFFGICICYFIIILFTTNKYLILMCLRFKKAFKLVHLNKTSILGEIAAMNQNIALDKESG